MKAFSELLVHAKADAMRTICLFCILCGIALYTPSLAAQPREVRLEYVRGPRAESCPSEAVVRSAIRGQMRYDPFNPKAPERLVVTMSGEGGKIRGRAELRSAAGTWEGNAEPQGCEVVLASLALQISGELDPWFAASKKPRPALGSPSTTTTATPKSAPPATGRTAAHRLRIGIGAGGEVTSGPGPSDITGHPNVMFLLAWHFLRLGVEVEYEPPTTTEVRGATLTTWRLTGGLVPCAHWNELFGCAVGQLGASFGEAKAYTSDSATDLYGAGGGRLGLQFPATTWLTVALYGELLATFNRPALLVDDERAWVHVGATGTAGAQALVFF
jgi:hypothetical protein